MSEFAAFIVSLLQARAVAGENKKTCIKPPVFIFVLASICTTLATAVLQAPPSVAQPGMQADSSVNTVDFGDLHYAIPNAYAPGITPSRAKGYEEGRGYAAFTLSLLLPDLHPQGLSDEGLAGHGWGKHLQALFEYGLSLREQKDIVDQRLEGWKISKDDYLVEKNGCHLYQGKLTISEELHVCFLPSRLFVYMCKTKTAVPYPSCDVHERLNPNTTLIYEYSQDFSNEAIEIDDRIRALANSFLRPDTSQTP